MKLLTLVFSLYIALLHVLPCSDSDFSDQSFQIEVVIDRYADHPENHGFDQCTPFCACHCCQIHIIDSVPLRFRSTMIKVAGESYAQFNNFGKEFAKSLLRPPQV